MPLELPPLPYAMDALEPYIDARTVEIHYTKHHATYLKNFNSALEKHPELAGCSVEELLSHIQDVPEDIRTMVRNHGGGFYNHNVYWMSMTVPAGTGPAGEVAKIIEKDFGSILAFQQEFEKAGANRFGSGYAWLCKKPDGSILIHTTANQDSPLSENLVPLFVVDVWEHAYYLKYQNRRAEYLSNWWNVLNWREVDRRFSEN